MFKKDVKIHWLCCVLLFSIHCVFQSVQAGQINYLNIEGNIIEFSTSSGKSEISPSCVNADDIDKWAFSLEHLSGEVMLTSLYTSIANNKNVNVVSSGDCAHKSNVERPLSVVISTDSKNESSNTFNNLDIINHYILFPTVAVNTPPVANIDNVGTEEDNPLLAIDVMANDYDDDGDAIKIVQVSALYGSVFINENNSLFYTPPLNFSGVDEIAYELSDGKGGLSNSKVIVDVAALNDAPTATSDSIVTLINTYQTEIDVLNNDHDVENDDLFILAASTDSGNVIISEEGKLLFTAQQGFTGLVEILYIVSDGDKTSNETSVQVYVVPDTTPIVFEQTNVVANEDNHIELSLDYLEVADIDSSTFELIVRSGDNYSVNGNVVRPIKDFNGTLIVPVEVSDGTNLSDVFLMTVNVLPVNDAPDAGYIRWPVAQNSSTSINLGAMFSDAEALKDPTLYSSFTYTLHDSNQSIIIEGKTDNGTIVAVEPENAPNVTPAHFYNYTPDPGYVGDDYVVFFVYDEKGARSSRGDLIFEVAPNIPPQWAMSTVTVQQPVLLKNISPSVTFCRSLEQPTIEAIVKDNFAIFTKASEQQLTSWECQNSSGAVLHSFTSALLISEPLQLSAVADMFEVKEGESLVLDVLANDIVTDFESLRIVSNSQPDIGEVYCTETNCTFDASNVDIDENIATFFNYTISDETSATSLANVDIQISKLAETAVIEFAGTPVRAVVSSDDAGASIGAVPGTFRVDESGAATYNVPLSLPQGIAGVTPDLSLNYHSSAGNGALGIGWSVSGSSVISRCRQTYEQDGVNKAVELNTNDRFCLNGQRLILVSGSEYGSDGAVYRTEIDSRMRITSLGSQGKGPASFSIEREDGSISYYGTRSDAQLTHDDRTVLTWYLASMADNIRNPDNTVTYHYYNGTAGFGENEILLSNIDYSGNQVTFTYSTNSGRTDTTSIYYHGTTIESTVRLEDIKVKNHQNVELASYTLGYETDSITGFERINSITQCGLSGTVCYPATTFEWHNQLDVFVQTNWTTKNLGSDNIRQAFPLDIDSDGFSDVVYVSHNGGSSFDVNVSYNNGTGVMGTATRLFSFTNGNENEYPVNVTPLDIDGDGMVEFVYYTGAGSSFNWMYYDLDDSILVEFESCYYNTEYCTVSSYSSHNVNMGISVSTTTKDVLFHDVNADAFPDMVYRADGNNWIALNTKDGQFDTPKTVAVTMPDRPSSQSNYGLTAYSASSNISSKKKKSESMDSLLFDEAIKKYKLKKPKDKKKGGKSLSTGIGKSSSDTGIARKGGDCSEEDPCVYFTQSDVNSFPTKIPPIDVNGDGQADILLRMIDIYGVFDGVVDTDDYEYYWMAYELVEDNGTYQYLPLGELLNSRESGEMFSEDHLYVGDIDSDGLGDVLRLIEGTSTVNYGLSGTPDMAGGGQFELAANQDDVTSFQIVDTNRDGRADVIYFIKDIKRWTVHKQLADGSFDVARPLGNASYETTYEEYDQVFIADWNGDGEIGFGRVEYNDKKLLYRTDDKAGNLPANRIHTITNGLGLSSEIKYGLMTNPEVYTKGSGAKDFHYGRCQFDGTSIDDFESLCSPVFDIVNSGFLVKEVLSQAPGYIDGTYTASNLLSVQYHYEGLRIQSGGRGNLGFEKLYTYDPDRDITTETQYRQDFPYVGMPLTTRQYMGARTNSPTSNTLMSTANNEYQHISLFSGSIFYPYLYQSTTSQYAIGNTNVNDDAVTQLHSSVVTTNTHTLHSSNNHTNLKQIIVETKDASGSTISTVTTDNQYAQDDVDKWWLARLTNTTVEHHRPSAVGLTRINRESSFQYNDDGMLEVEIIAPNSGDNLKLYTRHCYDDVFGHEIKTIQSNTQITDCDSAVTDTTNSETAVYRSTSVIFDTDKRYPVTTHSALVSNLSTVNGRNAFGQVTQSTDINGVVTTVAYNSFGQQVASANDIGAYSEVTRRLSINASEIEAPNISEIYYFVERHISHGKPTVYNYFDVIGRKVGQAQKGFDGRYVLTIIKYDQYGRVVEQSVPYYAEEQTQFYSTTVYDRFARPKSSTAADGVTTTTYHYGADGLSITSTVVSSHQVSQSQTEYKNYFGETWKVQDANNWDIEYFYDATGNLSQVKNEDEVTITTGFDSYGRKVSMVDPDKGTWAYTYNALGELVSQTDGKNQVTRFFRDAEGRTVKRISPDDTTVYQFEGHQLKAECFATEPNCDSATEFVKHYDYDQFGRPEILSTIVDGNMFQEKTVFDRFGRVFQTFDATGDFYGIRYHYNDNGYLLKQEEARYSGSADETLKTVYYEVLEMDALGNVTSANQNDNRLQTNKYYDPQTGFIESINTTSNGISVQQNAYSFDGIGNLRSRTRNSLNAGEHTLVNNLSVNIQHQVFKYDALNRLTHINDVEQAQYRDNGNIHWKAGVGYYCYGASGPHAVTGIGTENCSDDDYQYDENGNMEVGRGRIIAYSAFDKPVSINNSQGSTLLSYGTNRSRFKRETQENGAVTKTLYIGSVEYVFKDGQYSETRRYLPGAIQTQFSGGANSTRYLLKDHLGSIDSVLNQQGELIEKLYFDVWGTKISIAKESWTATVQSQSVLTLVDLFDITPRGFTGHEHIAHADIIHMNGRIYDPTIGRFLQADPHIQAPKNSQSYNRYSYVLNNPLSYTDPSGYFFKSLGKFVKKYWRVIAAAVVSVVTYGAASGWAAGWLAGTSLAGSQIAIGAIAGGITGFVGGGIATGSLRGALQGAFSGAVFGAIGGSFKAYGIENVGAQMGIHAVAGGIMSDLQGGKFGHGFFTAGVMKGFGKINFGDMNVIGRTVIQAIVGGTMSRVTGGKFANGAVTAALQFVVNEKSGWIREQWDSLKKSFSIIGSEGSKYISDSKRQLAEEMKPVTDALTDAPVKRSLQFVGGVAEVAGGAAACIGIVTCAAGGLVAAHGFSNISEALGQRNMMKGVYSLGADLAGAQNPNYVGDMMFYSIDGGMALSSGMAAWQLPALNSPAGYLNSSQSALLGVDAYNLATGVPDE